MRSFLFFNGIAICLTVCEAAMGSVLVSECSGDIPHQTASYIDDSLKALILELPADELGECVLKAHGDNKPDGISLQIKLECEDEETFEETRIVTSASAASQARTMARNLLRERDDFWKNRPTTVEIHSLGLVVEDQSLKNSARAGMTAGYAIAISGLVSFFTIGFVGQLTNSDVYTLIICVPGNVVMLGNIVIFSAYAVRHRSYHDAGRKVRVYPAILTGLVTAFHAGLNVGSMIEFSKPIDPDDLFQMSWNAVILAGSAILVEIVNLALCTNLWRREFRQADRIGKVNVSVVPTAFPNALSRNGTTPVGIGLAGSF